MRIVALIDDRHVIDLSAVLPARSAYAQRFGRAA